jgi:hypothetical protein
MALALFEKERTEKYLRTSKFQNKLSKMKMGLSGSHSLNVLGPLTSNITSGSIGHNHLIDNIMKTRFKYVATPT